MLGFLLFFSSITRTAQFFIPIRFAFITSPQYLSSIRGSSTCVAANSNQDNSRVKVVTNTLNRDRRVSPLSTSRRSMMDANDMIANGGNNTHHHGTYATTSDNAEPRTKNNGSKEPIYITIGPQGAGKTTLLSKILIPSSIELNENYAQASTSILDVAIDDQRGVYWKIPVELFCANGTIEESSMLYSTHSNLLQYNLYNKTISQRINDPSNDEMRYITQRLSNKITRRDFEEKINALYINHNSIQSTWQKVLYRDLLHGAINQLEYESSGDLITCLVETVEDFLMYDSDASSDFPVSHVDLYVTECIFKELPQEDPLLLFNLELPSSNVHFDSVINKQWFDYVKGRNMSGLAAAVSKLGFLAESDEFQGMPLAWGNTNSKARDYSAALDVAAKSGRPVQFIPYMNPNHLNIHCDSVHHYLPRVGMKTLIQRNIRRYMNTGRFIPTRAIIDTCHRVDELIEDAFEKMKKDKSNNETMVSETEATGGMENFSKFELDCAMAALASFGMRKDRTVYRMPRESWGRGRGANNSNNYNSNRMAYQQPSRSSEERYLDRNPEGRGDRYHGYNPPSGRGRSYRDDWGRGRYSQRPGEGREGQGYKRHYQGDDRRDYQHNVGGRRRYDRADNRPYGHDPRQQPASGTRGEESTRFGSGRGQCYPNRDGRGSGRGDRMDR